MVLPSYREGFGNSLIEASALRKPVVGTNVTGCCDAVIDNKTGILVKPKEVYELQEAIRKLANSDQMRQSMGQCGHRWIESAFDRKVVWSNLLKLYEQMLRSKTFL